MKAIALTLLLSAPVSAASMIGDAALVYVLPLEEHGYELWLDVREPGTTGAAAPAAVRIGRTVLDGKGISRFNDELYETIAALTQGETIMAPERLRKKEKYKFTEISTWDYASFGCDYYVEPSLESKGARRIAAYSVPGDVYPSEDTWIAPFGPSIKITLRRCSEGAAPAVSVKVPFVGYEQREKTKEGLKLISTDSFHWSYKRYHDASDRLEADFDGLAGRVAAAVPTRLKTALKRFSTSVSPEQPRP